MTDGNYHILEALCRVFFPAPATSGSTWGALVAVTLLLGGANPVAGAADAFTPLGAEGHWAPNDAETDTTFVARLEPLVVTGHPIDQTYSGTLASAEGPGAAAHAAASAGAPRSPAADSGDVTLDGVSIGGLIVNETFSVIGARFARTFNDKWTEPDGVQDLGYTVTLGENPAPRRGAQVFVDVEGETLFQAYLRPNRRQIQQAAQRAVGRVTIYLQKYYEPREVY